MNRESHARRRVAVLGGNRIPFARSNTAYADASNQEMLIAALDGLVTRFGLEGERVGEVAAGAVLKHSRDFNLVRESVLGSRLAAETPGDRHPAGVRHGSPGRRPSWPTRSRSASSSPASAAAATPRRTRPWRSATSSARS